MDQLAEIGSQVSLNPKTPRLSYVQRLAQVGQRIVDKIVPLPSDEELKKTQLLKNVDEEITNPSDKMAAARIIAERAKLKQIINQRLDAEKAARIAQDQASQDQVRRELGEIQASAPTPYLSPVKASS